VEEEEEEEEEKEGWPNGEMPFGAKNEFGSLVTTSYLHKNMLHFCPIYYLQLQLYL
jgi:hypothetical protein